MVSRGDEVRVRLQTLGEHRPGTKDASVVARLEGESDEVVVLGAHYNSAWLCPGAIDNATGVAVMLEVARRAAERRVRRSFEFVAFAAEEWWLLALNIRARGCATRGDRQLQGDDQLRPARAWFNPRVPGGTGAVPWRGRQGPRRAEGVRAIPGRLPRAKERLRPLPLLARGCPGRLPDPHAASSPVPRSTDVVEAVSEKVQAIVDIVDAIARAVDRPGSSYGE
jgi:Peptidase family M28